MVAKTFLTQFYSRKERPTNRSLIRNLYNNHYTFAFIVF